MLASFQASSTISPARMTRSFKWLVIAAKTWLRAGCIGRISLPRKPASSGLSRTMASYRVPSLAGPQTAERFWFPGRGEFHLIDTQTGKISAFKADGALEKSIFWMPAWPPDQKRIYFAAGMEGQEAFFESDPDLKNVRELLRQPKAGGLNLTPDVRWIVTPIPHHGAGALALWRQSRSRGKEPRIFLEGPSRGNIFISPDGKYIALVNASPATGTMRTASLVTTSGKSRSERQR